MDRNAESFYSSVGGVYEKPVKKNTRKNPEEWSEQANNYFKGHDIPKRVIDLDGRDEIYNSSLIRFLTFMTLLGIIAIIGLAVIGGIYVYKYEPNKIDQPISINPNLSVEGDEINVDATDKIYPEFNNENNANIIIEKIEVTCIDGGCTGEGNGTG